VCRAFYHALRSLVGPNPFEFAARGLTEHAYKWDAAIIIAGPVLSQEPFIHAAGADAMKEPDAKSAMQSIRQSKCIVVCSRM